MLRISCRLTYTPSQPSGLSVQQAAHRAASCGQHAVQPHHQAFLLRGSASQTATLHLETNATRIESSLYRGMHRQSSANGLQEGDVLDSCMRLLPAQTGQWADGDAVQPRARLSMISGRVLVFSDFAPFHVMSCDYLVCALSVSTPARPHRTRDA